MCQFSPPLRSQSHPIGNSPHVYLDPLLSGSRLCMALTLALRVCVKSQPSFHTRVSLSSSWWFSFPFIFVLCLFPVWLCGNVFLIFCRCSCFTFVFLVKEECRDAGALLCVTHPGTWPTFRPLLRVFTSKWSWNIQDTSSLTMFHICCRSGGQLLSFFSRVLARKVEFSCYLGIFLLRSPLLFFSVPSLCLFFEGRNDYCKLVQFLLT